MGKAALAVVLMFGASQAFGSDWETSLTPRASHEFDANLGDATLAVTRGGILFKTGSQLNQQLIVGASLDAEYANYDFGDLFSTAPADFLAIDVRPSASFYFSENLGVYGGAILGFGGEPSADIGDSLIYGAFGGFNYQIAKDLWVGAGLGVSTQLEDDVLYVPLVTIDWKINDQLSLEANGLSGKLTYAIDKQWSIFAEGSYQLRRYRLDDDSIVSDGVLADDYIPVGIGVSYAPSDHVTISLVGGAVVWREIEFIDDDENEIASEDAEITPYVAASVKISW